MKEQDSGAPGIWVLTLGIMVIGSNSFVLSPILIDVARDLDSTPIAVARAISAFGAATALTSFLFARSAVTWSARRILCVGGTVLALFLLGSALSRAWWHLALCQAAIGAMVGGMLPTIYDAATANAPAGQGGRTLGRVIRGWGIALVLGVPFSAFVADMAGWRAVYLILAGFAALTVAGFARLPRGAAGPAEPAGQVGPAGPRPSLGESLSARGARPLLLICLLYMTAFYGLYPYLGTRLHEAIGASASLSGIVVLAYGAGFGLASYAMGAVDRWGARRVFPVVLLVLGAIYVGLPPATTHIAPALAAAFLWGVANHVGVNLIILLLSRRGETRRRMLLGLHTTITYGSIFLGPFLLGQLYDRIGFAAACAASALFVVLAAAVAWTRRADW
ncbi:MFS transporter [Marivibrio halodurans]|uniref:MFS transporter n=1 Tax=Marivibrio halodurans TaxID=2039722 RepID=A0A8J7V312_9PROT|nr:MFS transporter [Marivibrio halodurans]MBP5857910.1 MFS transporter [Marivibrio halodurans]